jgi:hypothetical protein
VIAGHPVAIFNSGLEVWLYDKSFGDALKSSGAFEEDADNDAFEKAMQGFVRDGRIMAYRLVEDSGVDIVIAVREPLTEAELGATPFLAPQRAFLRLPSGCLVIESNDSLTIRQSKPTDAGAEVQVPPGDYLATLYRVDTDAAKELGNEWQGPSEIITLTCGDDARPVDGQPAVLPWERTPTGDATWTVQDGEYAGAVVFHDADKTMSIAIDPAGIAQLGLQDKSLAMLAVPDLGLECLLVCLTGDKSRAAYYERMEKVLPPLPQAGKPWAFCQLESDAAVQSILCVRRRATTPVPYAQQNRWLAATVRVLAGRALEKR